jgi:hypothetical protein
VPQCGAWGEKVSLTSCGGASPPTQFAQISSSCRHDWAASAQSTISRSPLCRPSRSQLYSTHNPPTSERYAFRTNGCTLVSSLLVGAAKGTLSYAGLTGRSAAAGFAVGSGVREEFSVRIVSPLRAIVNVERDSYSL